MSAQEDYDYLHKFLRPGEYPEAERRVQDMIRTSRPSLFGIAEYAVTTLTLFATMLIMGRGIRYFFMLGEDILYALEEDSNYQKKWGSTENYRILCSILSSSGFILCPDQEERLKLAILALQGKKQNSKEDE